MTSRRRPEWVSLSEAQLRIWSTFEPNLSFLAHEAIANAVVSGQVPVQGVPRGKTLPVTIDGRTILPPERGAISLNELTLKETYRRPLDPDFRAVKINWKMLETYVRETRDGLLGRPPRPADGAVKSALRDSVKRHEAERTRPTRAKHIAEIRQELPGVTEAQYDELKTGIVPADWSRPGRPPKR
jgi:hypothetical protein